MIVIRRLSRVWLIGAWLGGAGISPGPLAAVFQDDFEGYPVGSTAAWDLGSGAPVVNELTVDLFGSPNQALALTSPARKILTDVAGAAVGEVTTFSCDFAESPGGAQTSGLQVGYAQATDINVAGAAVRVSLRGGAVHHVDLGGLSTLTQTGQVAYAQEQPHRIYIVVNHTPSPLVDYQGQEDLAADSFEVWLRSGAGLQHVLEATIGRDPNYAGLRTWSGFDSAFYVDRVRIDAGVSLAPGDQVCSLNTSHPGVAVGGTVTVEWAAAGLPVGSTFELSSDGDVTFPHGAATGDAAAGSGQVEATVNAAGMDIVTFTLLIRDAASQPVCSSQRSVAVVDFSSPSQLPHPSVTSSAGQLAFMRDQVLNVPGSLARAGWDAMLATPYAALSYPHAPQATVSVVPSGVNDSERAFRNDSQAARCHALQWVVTGEPAHRDKTIAILSDWGRSFRQMVSTGGAAQIQLESAWALPVWLSAADILRYHQGGSANWNQTDMASFHVFARALYENARRAMGRQNNWGVSASLAVMAYGTWTDDLDIFEQGFTNQLGLLDTMSEMDGEIAETCRDTWHPQYSVVTWADSAELARNLGRLDLYETTYDGQATPRLALVLEYFANLMLGNTSHPCGSGWAYDYLGAYDRFDNYEVAFNHYLNRDATDALPVFAEMVENFWRSAVGEDAHFLLWSRLSHGDNAYRPLPPPDTYAIWVNEHFTSQGITHPALTASDADFNGDGIANGLHYWTLTDPRAAALEPILIALPADAPDPFKIRIVERSDAETVGRVFLFAPDLATGPSAWEEVIPDHVTIVEDRGDPVVRDAVFPSLTSPGFLAIRYPPVWP